MRKILIFVFLLLAASATADLGPPIFSHVEQKITEFIQECDQGVKGVYHAAR